MEGVFKKLLDQRQDRENGVGEKLDAVDCTETDTGGRNRWAEEAIFSFTFCYLKWVKRCINESETDTDNIKSLKCGAAGCFFLWLWPFLLLRRI